MRRFWMVLCVLGAYHVPAFCDSLEYRVGAGDVIEIDVFNHPEFHSISQVSPEGRIRMAIMGEIKVASLTLREIDRLLTGMLAKDYLKNPRVIVSTRQINNMSIYIFGQVQHPGLKQLGGPTNLLELIALAGDFTQGAGSEITIERQHERTPGDKHSDTDEREPETITVDLQKLLKEGDLSLNVPLRNGDKIYVPELSSNGQVYVFGQVAQPGYYPYTPGTTLYDAIKRAGGFTELANEKSIKIKRKSGRSGDEREVIKVNLKKMLKQGDLESNIPLKPDDIVVVPSSFFF